MDDFLRFVGGLTLFALGIGLCLGFIWLFFDYVGIRNNVKHIKAKMRLSDLHEE